MSLRSCTYVLLGVVLTAGLCVQSSGAQPSDRAAVRSVISTLFDGMRAGDSTAVRSAFHERAGLHTALGPSDTSAVNSTPVEAFVRAVGEPHEKVWDERVWDVEIRIDGPLASAWVPYAFYHGEELSHCGVNAMQFVRTADGWKIYQLTDSRRKNCDVPEDARK